MKRTNLNQEGRLLQHSLLGGYCTDIRVSFLYIMSCISANSCKRIRIKVLTARQVSRCTILAACKHNETRRVTPTAFAGSRHNDGTNHKNQKNMSGYQPCTKCHTPACGRSLIISRSEVPQLLDEISASHATSSVELSSTNEAIIECADHVNHIIEQPVQLWWLCPFRVGLRTLSWIALSLTSCGGKSDSMRLLEGFHASSLAIC